jgi:putative tricarboxylic transport membrane protein
MKKTTLGRLFARNTATLLGWCAILFAGIVAYLTSRFEPMGERVRSLPPTFFPYLLSGALILLGMLLLMEGYRKKEGPVLGISYGADDIGRAVGLLAVLVVFAWAQSVVGFLPAAVLLMAGMQFILGERRIAPLVIASVCVPVALYLVFYTALKVPLPRGFW